MKQKRKGKQKREEDFFIHRVKYLSS
jgi:hypothetical protein